MTRREKLRQRIEQVSKQVRSRIWIASCGAMALGLVPLVEMGATVSAAGER